METNLHASRARAPGRGYLESRGEGVRRILSARGEAIAARVAERTVPLAAQA